MEKPESSRSNDDEHDGLGEPEGDVGVRRLADLRIDGGFSPACDRRFSRGERSFGMQDDKLEVA